MSFKYVKVEKGDQVFAYISIYEDEKSMFSATD